MSSKAMRCASGLCLVVLVGCAAPVADLDSDKSTGPVELVVSENGEHTGTTGFDSEHNLELDTIYVIEPSERTVLIEIEEAQSWGDWFNDEPADHVVFQLLARRPGGEWGVYQPTHEGRTLASDKNLILWVDRASRRVVGELVDDHSPSMGPQMELGIRPMPVDSVPSGKSYGYRLKIELDTRP